MRLLRSACQFAVIGFSLAATPLIAAEHEAADWLERMVRAAHQLNYSGTFVYQQRGSLQSMKIIHAVNDNGERERLVSLTGPSREVIRDREKVTCILPEDSPIVVEHAGSARAFPLMLPSDLSPLLEHYEISLDGEDRIAGLAAHKVVITPRDSFRYGQRYWVADDSGLLLRAEVINEEGEVVEQVMFTSLQMHESIPPELLQPEVSGESRVLRLSPGGKTRTLPDAREAAWKIDELPDGFSQQMQRNHFLPEKEGPVEHHLYSDGLASVSVFIEQASGEDAFVGPSSIGGVNAYGRVLNGHVITVVGEVPPVTVKYIAESLRQVQHD